MSTLTAQLGHQADLRRLPAPAVLRFIRTRAGVTQAAIAAEVGVTRSAVARWESGTRKPGPGTAEIYAAVIERLVEAGAR